MGRPRTCDPTDHTAEPCCDRIRGDASSAGSAKAQPARLAGGKGELGSQPTSASSAPWGLGPEMLRKSNAQVLAVARLAGKALRAVQLLGCITAAVAGGTPPRAACAFHLPAPRAWGAATLRPSSSHPFSDRSPHSRPFVGITCSGLCPSPIGAGTDLACRAQPRMPGGAGGAACLSVCSINQLVTIQRCHVPV